MKMTVILFVIGALETVPKGLVRRLGWKPEKKRLVGWFVWFYGVSTFVGYLTPNPFLCK